MFAVARVAMSCAALYQRVIARNFIISQATSIDSAAKFIVAGGATVDVSGSGAGNDLSLVLSVSVMPGIPV